MRRRPKNVCEGGYFRFYRVYVLPQNWRNVQRCVTTQGTAEYETVSRKQDNEKNAGLFCLQHIQPGFEGLSGTPTPKLP